MEETIIRILSGKTNHQCSREELIQEVKGLGLYHEFGFDDAFRNLIRNGIISEQTITTPDGGIYNSVTLKQISQNLLLSLHP